MQHSSIDSNEARSLSEWRSRVDENLASIGALCSSESLSCVLPEAANYAVVGGGKRLRALLCCSVWSDLSAGRAEDSSRAIAAATALEVLHAASLVHDDLPALDNDDLRRGKPSCHKAYGEATAILAGDALVGLALLYVTREALLSSDEHARITQILIRAWVDLCIGQQLDIDQQTHNDTEASSHGVRQKMIRLKTGALFGAAVACGALCAGVRNADLPRFAEWGVRVGECFQAIDDLDDGDRPLTDRETVRAECREIMKASSELDARLAVGVSKTVLEMLLSVLSDR